MSEEALCREWTQRFQAMDVPVTALSPDAPAPEGCLSLLSWMPSLRLCCPADTPGAMQLLTLAAALVRGGMPGAGQTDQARLLRLLTGAAPPSEAETQPLQPAIGPDCPGRVLLFRAPPDSVGDLAALLESDAPLADGAQAVALAADQAALVLAGRLAADPEELAEYALAVAETLSVEEGVSARVGVSEAIRSPADLAEGLRQADAALRLGPPETGVCLYERMLLARFLADVPRETRERYRALIFNPETERLLNREMLQTIQAFFDHDLNLSTTARALFIHRNTLVYRLDKIHRATGLDLRQFNDAAIFRVLVAMRES